MGGIVQAIFGSPQVPQAAPPPAPYAAPPTPQSTPVAKQSEDTMRLRAGMGRASTLLTQPDEDALGGPDNRMTATKGLGF
jgi:hypothetical protein